MVMQAIELQVLRSDTDRFDKIVDLIPFRDKVIIATERSILILEDDEKNITIEKLLDKGALDDVI